MGMKTLFLASLAGAVVLAGCSDNKRADDHWYAPSKSHKEQKDAFVDFHQEHGVSEVDAKNAWLRDQMIGNTQARQAVTVTGDEARDLAAPGR